MVKTDAKDETQRTRRDKKAAQRVCDSNEYQGVRCEGSTAGHKPFRVNREDWTGADSARRSGATANTPGGIIAELVEEARNELAQLDERRDKLTQHVERLEAIQQHLKDEIGE